MTPEARKRLANAIGVPVPFAHGNALTDLIVGPVSWLLLSDMPGKPEGEGARRKRVQAANDAKFRAAHHPMPLDCNKSV